MNSKRIKATSESTLVCYWCRKYEVPAGRLQTCGEDCHAAARKANARLAAIDRAEPTENLGGIGS